MQVQLCPEQLRQEGGQTQGKAGSTAAAMDSLPAFGLTSARKSEVLTALIVPALLPGFPCTLPMARTPHQPPGPVGPHPTNVTVGLVSSSPAWSWGPTKLGLTTCPGAASAHPQEVQDARGWGCPGALHCLTPDWGGVPGMGQALPCRPSGTHVVPASFQQKVNDIGARFLRYEDV